MGYNRCCCTTKNKLVCKRKSNFNIMNKNYCSIHAKMIYNCFVILIQRCYRGYRIRKKLNNLFRPLPIEIQHIILYYIKEPYYIQKYNNSITKILSNKIENIIKNPFLKIFLVSPPNISNYYLNIKFYENFIYLFNLYTKLSEITNSYYDRILFIYTNEIWDILNNQIRNAALFDENGINLVLTNNWKDIYEQLYISIIRYKNIYNLNYSDKNKYTYSNYQTNNIYYEQPTNNFELDNI